MCLIQSINIDCICEQNMPHCFYYVKLLIYYWVPAIIPQIKRFNNNMPTRGPCFVMDVKTIQFNKQYLIWNDLAKIRILAPTPGLACGLAPRPLPSLFKSYKQSTGTNGRSFDLPKRCVVIDPWRGGRVR